MSHPSIKSVLEWIGLVGLLSASGCGGAAQPAHSAGDEPAAESRRPDAGGGEDQMTAMAETGALSKADVQSAFHRSMRQVNRCVADGRKRVPILDGDIDVYLRINQMGRAVTAYFTKSTLGDHRVEACILKALQAQQWPRPVGGEIGESTQSLGFGRDPDEEEPLHWTAESLAQAMTAEAAAEAAEEPAAAGSEPGGASAFEELTQKLDRCRADAGVSRLLLSMYLDEDGMVRAVGLSSPDENGRAAVDCVETVVQTTSFPSPRTNFAKLVMSVP